MDVSDLARLWAEPGTPYERILEGAGRAEVEDPDAWDCWFLAEVRIEDDAARELSAPGISGTGSIFWDGEEIAAFAGAFTPVRVRLPRGAGSHRLAIRCRALAAEKTPRRPRARWLSSLVSRRWLRWHRVPLVGRFPWPGTAPILGPHAGLGVHRVEPRLEQVRALLSGTGEGRVSARIARDPEARDTDERPLSLQLLDPEGDLVTETALGNTADSAPDGEIVLGLDRPRRWWPLGHGEQPLYALRLVQRAADGRDEHVLDSRTLGFRTVAWAGTEAAPVLAVNGRRIFSGGAVWQPPNPKVVASAREDLVPALDLLAEAGVVMLRVPGTHGYESEAFYEECSRRGILVWQDAPLASMDYPDDPDWTAAFRAETRANAARLAAHPGVVVLCGGAEVLQQPEMFGLPSGTTVPALDVVREEAVDAGLLPVLSSPSGGVPAIRPDHGFSHWFGVGAYQRPLSSARTDRVRFASEALAFGTWAEPRRTRTIAAARAAGTYAEATEPIQDPAADWTFQDVTAHYARRFFPYYDDAGTEFRRHLERAACALAVSTTMAWWRWAGSGTAGALVLSSQDITDGPDWGLLDRDTTPKAGWYGLAQALRPVALSISDEGLNGLHLDVFLPEFSHGKQEQPHRVPEDARLRLRAVDAEGTVTEDVTVTLAQARALGGVDAGDRSGAEGRPGSEAPGGAPEDARSFRVHVETVLGGFRDLDHVWGFGEQQRAALVAELLAPEPPEGDAEAPPLAQTVRLLGLGPDQVHALDPRLGITARFVDERTVALLADRPAACVSIDLVPRESMTPDSGYYGGSNRADLPVPLDGYLHLAPGIERRVRLSGPVDQESTRIIIRTTTKEEEM